MASTKATYSEPSYSTMGDTKAAEFPWYLDNIDKYNIKETQQLLETYSGIPKDQQSAHVHKIRDQAWAIRKYPCTGLGVWLDPFLAHSPAYATILQCLKSGGTILDVGAFLGTDLRRLAFDGAPTKNMYAVDIVSHWDIGFDLYNDRDKFEGHFIEADVLAADSNPALKELHGKMDVIGVSAVFHQWSWDGQVDAAKKVSLFAKPGTIVVGHQVGAVEAKARNFGGNKIQQWQHDSASFARMWDQVGQDTQTKWKTDVRLVGVSEVGWDPKDASFLGEDARVVDFVVTRIE